jgi:effector-binding domain-containing protein
MDIEVKELEAQPALCLRTRTSMDKLPQTIGEGYQKIAALMGELGESPADVPYTAYSNMDMNDLAVEMGFTTAKALQGKGDVVPGRTPEGKAVITMYKGPYSGMEAVYNEIFAWMGERKLEPRGKFYEFYYNSPGEVPEGELLTRIVIPVK